jgi:hypothetical protein
MMALDAVIIASCPDAHQDKVTEICKVKNFQKAYGRAGDMVNDLKGKDWVGKWQAKVVMAAITKAQSMKVNRVKIICIEGGKFCNDEYASVPHLKAAIVKEWNDNGNSSSLRVECLWLSFEAFAEDHGLGYLGPSAELRLAASVKSSLSITDTKPKAKKEAEKQQLGTSGLSKSDGSASKPVKTNNIPTGKTKDSPSLSGNEMSCEGCNRSFASADAMIKHVLETDHIFTIYSCKGCDESFSVVDVKNALPLNRCKQHQDSTGHRGYKKMTTSVSTLKALKQKKEPDAEDDEEEWECGECQKTFRSERALTSHQQSTGHKDPTCMACLKSFGSQSSLEQHLQATGHFFIPEQQIPSVFLTNKASNNFVPDTKCLICKCVGQTDPLLPDFLLCNVPDCSCYIVRAVREKACGSCGNGYYLQHSTNKALRCINCLAKDSLAIHTIQQPALCVYFMPLSFLNECSLKELKAYCELKRLNLIGCVEKKEIVSLVYRDRLNNLQLPELELFASSKKLNISACGNDRSQIIEKVLEIPV